MGYNTIFSQIPMSLWMCTPPKTVTVFFCRKLLLPTVGVGSWNSCRSSQVLLLQKQYHLFQYVGATTIVLGIVLDKAPCAPAVFFFEKNGVKPVFNGGILMTENLGNRFQVGFY